MELLLLQKTPYWQTYFKGALGLKSQEESIVNLLEVKPRLVKKC